MPHVSLNQLLDDIQACPEDRPIFLQLAKLYRMLASDYHCRYQFIDTPNALNILSRRYALSQPILAVVITNIFVALLLANHRVKLVADSFDLDIWFKVELGANELPASIPTNILLVFECVLPMRRRIFGYLNSYYELLPGVDGYYHEKILVLSTIAFERRARIVHLALRFGMQLDGLVRLMLQSNKSLATSAAECLCVMVDSNQVNKQIVLEPPMFLEALRRLLEWNDEFASYYAGSILLHVCRLSDAVCGDVIVHPTLLNLLQRLQQDSPTHKDVRTVAAGILQCCQIRQVSARIKLRKQCRSINPKRNADSACLFQSKNRARKRKQNPESEEVYLGLTDCAI